MALSDRRIAYVNLTTGEIEIKPIPVAIRKKFLGGRGLDASAWPLRDSGLLGPVTLQPVKKIAL